MADAEFINRMVALIRLHADEPDVDAKYTPQQLLDLTEGAFEDVLVDLNAVQDAPLIVRHPLTFAQGTQEYLLPPGIDQLLEIAEIDSTTDRPLWSVYPRSARSPYGPIIRLEGRVLRLDPKWLSDSKTVRASYVPNGDFRLHYGTAGSATATTVVLAASPTTGTLDTRENAYAGAVLRILSDDNGYVQERTVTAYDRETRTATVSPAFDPTPTGTIVYEVVPTYSRKVERVVALKVAIGLRATARDAKGVQLLEREYTKAQRHLLLSEARKQNITGRRFEHDTVFRR